MPGGETVAHGPALPVIHELVCEPVVINRIAFRVNANGVPWSDCGFDAALEHAGFDGVAGREAASRHDKAASKPPPLQGAARNWIL